MPRPPFGSPEWLPYFEDIVRTSKTRGEAVSRLGYANPSVIDYHLKKFGIKRPPQWKLKPGVRRQRQERVPKVIMQAIEERSWAAALIQGEAGIVVHYSKKTDCTALEIRTSMTDEAPIFRLCDCFGVARPNKSRSRPNGWKSMWESVVSGLRAYRVLQEMLPFLLGQKLKEAERALEFFAPNGYRQGRFGGYDVWPESAFPLRKRGQARYEKSVEARLHHSNERPMTASDGDLILAPAMDVCCVRIADVLIQGGQNTGRYLTEIMQSSRLAWTTVIRHLRHLERNSLVTKQKVYQRLGGPKLLFKPSSRLLELKSRGWTSVT